MTAHATLDSEPVSLPAAGDLTAKLFRFGKNTATGIDACSVAGEAAAGVIGAHYAKTPVVGDAVDFYIERVMLVEAGAAVAANADVTTDNVGRAVTAGVGDVVNGKTIDAATAAGQYIRIVRPMAAASAGLVANAGVSPAKIRLSGAGLYVIDIPDAATATYVFDNAEKIEIVDAWNIKDGAGAANTIQITDSADAAISNAMAAAVDKTVTHAGTLDKAKRVLAADAGFKVVATRAAGTMAAQLFILAVKRA